VAAERALPDRALGDTIALRLVVPVATMLAIGAVALLVLLTPFYVHAALDLAGAPATVGFPPAQAHNYSDRTVGELLFGPATFEFSAPDGSPFYTADERAHMGDVRAVLFGFLGLAAVAAVLLAVVVVRRRGDPLVVRAIGRGGLVLAMGTVVVGALAAVAFDAAFTLFHRLLFPGGNFTFDPTSQRLVQLYPYAFWQLSAAVLGALLVIVGGLTWLLGRRRARRPTAAP
jgi:integral membrane protein (TIGR01906 family)